MQFIRIHRRIGALAAIALAATAISASAASAQVLDGPLHKAGQAGAGLSYNVAATARYSNTRPKAAPTASVTAPKIGTPNDNFHWGDAAIGGGVAVAIVLLATAGTVVIRRRSQLGEA